MKNIKKKYINYIFKNLDNIIYKYFHIIILILILKF